MRIVTLLSEESAREGYTFQFLESDLCNECKHRRPCVGRLRDRRVYRVVGVKDREGGVWCPLINDRVMAVYVTPARVRAAIPQKTAVEGAKITYTKVDCDAICGKRVLCSPVGLLDQDKAVIEEVGETVPCPLHRALVEASLTPIFD